VGKRKLARDEAYGDESRERMWINVVIMCISK